jgi:hypothetical protein
MRFVNAKNTNFATMKEFVDSIGDDEYVILVADVNDSFILPKGSMAVFPNCDNGKYWKEAYVMSQEKAEESHSDFTSGKVSYIIFEKNELFG